MRPLSPLPVLQRQAHPPGPPGHPTPLGLKEVQGGWGPAGIREAAPLPYGVAPDALPVGPQIAGFGVQERSGEPGHPPGPTPVSRFADPAEVALAADIADRAADGAIIFHPPPGEDVSVSPSLAGPSHPEGAPPSVQRAPEDPPAAVQTVVASPAPSPGGAGSDLDDLARRLYPKMRPYLKKELWLDRERAGMLTDLAR
jgi:hypothetical protein